MWITGTLDHVDCVDYGYSGLWVLWIMWIMDTVDCGDSTWIMDICGLLYQYSGLLRLCGLWIQWIMYTVDCGDYVDYGYFGSCGLCVSHHRML